MSIDRQVELEKEAVDMGYARTMAAQNNMTAKGNFDQTAVGRKLIKSYVEPVTEAIKELVFKRTPRMRKTYSVLQAAEPDVLALVSLTNLVTCLGTALDERDLKHGNMTLTRIAKNAGKLVEEHLKFKKFELENAALFHRVLETAKERNSTDYRYTVRILTNAMNKADVGWNSWSTDIQILVGMDLVTAADAVCDWFEIRSISKHDRTLVVDFTEEGKKWIQTSKHQAVSLADPPFIPMIVEPESWSDLHNGGYLSPRLRYRAPLMKSNNRRSYKSKELDMHLADILDADCVAIQAVNVLQQTSWRVNTDILGIAQLVWDSGLAAGMPSTSPIEIPECPIKDVKKEDMTPDQEAAFSDWKVEARQAHVSEVLRRAELHQFARAINGGAKFQNETELYFPMMLDFRGRTYCRSTVLSFQGMDLSKSMLRFSTAKALTAAGIRPFKIQGAGKFGYDKVSYDERIKWVDEQAEKWIAVAESPENTTSVWTKADKPYQFLAWCQEFAGYAKHGAAFESHLPIALDGSCNGLQHFSAMLLDPVGAEAVNLAPSDKPQDIYQRVADVAWKKVRFAAGSPDASEQDKEYALMLMTWVREKGLAGLPRSATKRSVMTLPYGSTLTSCKEYVSIWFVETFKIDPQDKERRKMRWKLANWLANLIWGSIGEVVIAARGAMQWLRKVARMVGKQRLSWIAPNGWPVVMQTNKQVLNRITHNAYNSRYTLDVYDMLPDVDVNKHVNGVSPNFVHSVDAAHLHMVTLAAQEEGIASLAMIHDDFGTHAADIDKLQRIIRSEFVSLHETRPLESFRQQMINILGESVPELPEYGDFDLQLVKKSEYFFG